MSKITPGICLNGLTKSPEKAVEPLQSFFFLSPQTESGLDNVGVGEGKGGEADYMTTSLCTAYVC